MKPRDLNLIRKMISECSDVLRYTDVVGKDTFMRDDVYQKATSLSILNIGEHTNMLSREIWSLCPVISWRKIVDLRNLVAHGYGEVSMELIWNLSRKEIPELKKHLEILLDSSSEET